MLLPWWRACKQLAVPQHARNATSWPVQHSGPPTRHPQLLMRQLAWADVHMDRSLATCKLEATICRTATRLPQLPLLPTSAARGAARGGVPGWRHRPGRRCREGWSSPPPPAAGTRGQFSQLLPATAAPATVVLPPPAGPAACTASRHADSSKGQHQARGAAVQSPSPACQQQPTCSAASTAASGSSQPGASVWCRS